MTSPTHTFPPSPLRDREFIARTAATWVAATGAFLILAAAITVTAAHWWSFSNWTRAAALLGYMAAAGLGSRLARARTPGVALVLAHLAALLAVPVAIAVAITAGADWEEAVLAGGAAGVVAALVVQRTDDAPLLGWAAIGEVIFGLGGLAALVDMPVGVLIAAAAVVAVVARRDRLATLTALAAPLAPVLAALGAAGIGRGTAVDLGAAGDVLAWAAPLAGTLSAGVLAVLAARRTQMVLGVASLAALVSGISVGMGALRPSMAVWLAVPGLALLAIEAFSVVTADDEFWAPLAEIVALIGESLAAIAGLCGLGLVAWATAARAPADASWALAEGLLAAGALVGAVRARPQWTRLNAIPMAATAAALAMATARTATGSALAVGGVLLVMAAVASRSHRVGVATCTWPLALAIPLVGVERSLEASGIGALVGIAIVILAGAVSLEPLRLEEFEGAATALAVVITGATAAMAASATPWTDWMLVPAMVAATVLMAWLRHRQPITSPFEWLVMAIAAGSALGQAGSWPTAVVWLVGAAAVAFEAAWDRDVVLANATAVIVPVTAALTMTAAGMAAGSTTLVLLGAAVAITGIAVSLGRATPLDLLGVATAAVALGAAIGSGDSFLVSLALVEAGAVVWLQGTLVNQRALCVIGQGGAIAGLVTMPFTSGLVDWIRSASAPYGVTDGDLAVAAFLALGCATGLVLRRRRPLSSWLAYGLPLGVFANAAISTLVTTNATWRAVAALAVGTIAVIAGGARRLAAPLVIGTGMIVAVVIVASGPQLASLPVWAWLAAGGSLLLVAATLIERGSRGEAERPRHLVKTVVSQFG